LTDFETGGKHLNVNRIREDFPILKRKINNHPLVYFDNAATSQKPVQVIYAIVDFYENHNANVGRAVHTLSQESTEMQNEAREKVAHFINARDSSEVVFVRGTTEAINLVAYSLGLHVLKKDDEVLLSLMEHHSNIVPWDIISRLSGFKIKYVNVNPDGSLDYEDFENKLSAKTKVVSLTHASNVTGAVNDIKRITKAAHDNGALMMVDGAQSVPHLPVDAKDLDADFLAFSGHKMLGPTGIGVLYGKGSILKDLTPFQGGGSMINTVSFDEGQAQCNIAYNDLPWKFEAGTPDISGIVGLGAAVKYLEEIGQSEIMSHEQLLTDYALKRMRELRNVVVYGHSDESLSCGIISFSVEGLSSHDIALFMDNFGIAIRSGYHCAQPLHKVFKLQSSARASFYLYNTLGEIDRFVDVLGQVK
jgi:cysteine desulfurase / selenocysteine lyase